MAHIKRQTADSGNGTGQGMEQAIKRVFDLLTAVIVLFILSPLIGLIALAIKLDDGGPVLFVQQRIGRAKRRFSCYKFRTIIVGADSRGEGLSVMEDDWRITQVGRFLRLWTLDEVPQLINVIKGDMSIVGPRAWVPQAAYCLLSDWRRFDVRPGMASLAWIHGRNRLSWEEGIRLDLWYVDHWSLRLDFYILARAFVLLCKREGVYMDEGRPAASR